MLATDLLDGGCVSHGVDRAFRAEHPAVLVRDDAPEVRLGAFWKPLLHMQKLLTFQQSSPTHASSAKQIRPNLSMGTQAQSQ